MIRENSRLDDDRNGPIDYLQSFWKLEQLAPKEDTPGILDDALAGLASRFEEAG